MCVRRPVATSRSPSEDESYVGRMTASTPSRPVLTRRRVLLGAGLGALAGAGALSAFNAAGAPSAPLKTFEVNHTDEEWRHLLTPQQYDVLRTAGTETPYSSPLNDEHRSGTFGCAGCGQALFSSTTKFDSGTGWPSFWKAMDNAVLERQDNSERNVAHRGALQPLWRAPRPRLQRWPPADRPALLHERRGDDVPAVVASRRRSARPRRPWRHDGASGTPGRWR